MPYMEPFEARFAGTCSRDCGSKIKPGEDILYIKGELVHADCPETEDATDKPVDACPVCWMTLCWCE